MSREPLLPRGSYPVFRPIPTRWMDNDIYGHVNNVTYYSWFDTALNAWLIEQGLLDPEKGEIIGLMVETGCRFASSVAFPEAVEAGLRVAQLGSSSVRYELGIFREGEETAAAQGFMVHVYVDRETRRPVPLPEAWRSKLTALA